MKRAFARLVLAGAVLTVACESPEATRTRAGGPGADTGNRRGVVLMHEGSEPYWDTPVLIPGQHGPIESADQARELSRRSASQERSPSTGSEEAPSAGAGRGQ